MLEARVCAVIADLWLVFSPRLECLPWTADRASGVLCLLQLHAQKRMPLWLLPHTCIRAPRLFSWRSLLISQPDQTQSSRTKMDSTSVLYVKIRH